MAETLGSLVDKLSIANIRIWHLEERRRDKSLTGEERLAAADAAARVNAQRARLVDEIDELFAAAVEGKPHAPLTDPKEKMYP